MVKMAISVIPHRYMNESTGTGQQQKKKKFISCKYNIDRLFKKFDFPKGEIHFAH